VVRKTPRSAPRLELEEVRIDHRAGDGLERGCRVALPAAPHHRWQQRAIVVDRALVLTWWHVLDRDSGQLVLAVDDQHGERDHEQPDTQPMRGSWLPRKDRQIDS
jgi:hypothetical protein